MTDKSQGFLQVMKDAPLGVRLCLAGVWIGALVAGTGSFLKGDWLSVSFFLAVIGHQTWLLSAVERGFSPSGGEKLAMSTLTILILLSSIVIFVRTFVS